MLTVLAYQIAENIDIRKFRKEFTGTELYGTTSEVFFAGEKGCHLYIFSYGVVVFSGYTTSEMNSVIDYIKPFCKNILPENISEEFVINEKSDNDRFEYSSINVSRFDLLVLRIIMLNVGQSAALDYFSQQSVQLLEETNHYTLKLERQGKLNINNKSLLRFIGKTLNVKNRIVENLYVFDTPDETWDDEYLNKIDQGLRSTFDLKIRFKDLDYNLQIVTENLQLFKDLMQHRRSDLLEIIIILLILVEVINLFIEKLF
ncbi:MAG: RMD1 family protein [Bacteroidota bacterium]|nr:RMD1 family protein [Bacteroidota bacterium]